MKFIGKENKLLGSLRREKKKSWKILTKCPKEMILSLKVNMGVIGRQSEA